MENHIIIKYLKTLENYDIVATTHNMASDSIYIKLRVRQHNSVHSKHLRIINNELQIDTSLPNHLFNKWVPIDITTEESIKQAINGKPHHNQIPQNTRIQNKRI